MNTETFKVEIEGIDGVKRIYIVSCDKILELIKRKVDYRLILEG